MALDPDDIKDEMDTEKRHIYTVLELSDIFYPIFEQYGVKRAILFGSYAKGKATAKSDIDILVDSGLKGLKFLGLADDMQIAAQKDVEVFDIKHIDKGSRIEQEIKSTGVLLFGRE